MPKEPDAEPNSLNLQINSTPSCPGRGHTQVEHLSLSVLCEGSAACSVSTPSNASNRCSIFGASFFGIPTGTIRESGHSLLG